MILASALFVAGLAMYAIERLRPRRTLDTVWHWRRRASALAAIQVATAFLGAVWLDPLLQPMRWFSAAPLGVVGGSLFGYLGVTLVWYLWHRARHEVPFLWRTLHQVHHSPTRMELLTTYYKHPLECLTNVVFGGVTLTLVLGLTPTQCAVVTGLCGLAEFFYHWNVRTPRWLGWFLQRPESHCIHHQEGRHASNYADLPLWDWLFGTLHNPTDDEVPCGFGRDETRLPEMLAFREVA